MLSSLPPRKTPTPRSKSRIRAVSKRKPTRVYAIDGGVQTFPDGRESCLPTKAGKAEYERRTWAMAERQGYACAGCGKAFTEDNLPTFDHARGRTVANLDERIVVNGEWQNAALCFICNHRKGSKKSAWIDGVYQEVKRGKA